jgi:hypothetical protein
VTRNSTLMADKWDDRSSNSDRCVYNAMSLPTELSSMYTHLIRHKMKSKIIILY